MGGRYTCARARSTSSSFDENRIKPIFKYTSLKNKIILDIGCGIGDYETLFSKKNAATIGLDINSYSLTLARSKSKALFILTDSPNLPLKSSIVDFIFCNEVIEHVNDDQELLSESHRVMKHNAYIMIYAPNKFFFWETHLRLYRFPAFFISWLPEAIRKALFKKMNEPYVRIYTTNKLLSMINKYFIIKKTYKIMPKAKRIRYKPYYKTIKKILEKLENTPLNHFGISIVIIAKK